MVNLEIKTPVCLIVFNRPDTTEKVFQAIRQVKPPILLVVSDGPRIDKLGEVEKCAAVRAIIDKVDWECQVLKNFSDVNMGLKRRVSTGLDWVFNNVEEAIILEDDCLPDPTFFRFCEDLLEYYRYDKRVMLITGTNFQFGLQRTEYSYYFSRYIDCWGWATWKRAWQHYDFEMKQWPEIRDNNWLFDILQDSQEVASWTNIFQNTYDGYINSWAYRWKLACWIQNGLTIIPSTNLVSNIGFNADAVHTKDNKSPFANTPVKAMDFPLRHPEFVIRDAEADNFTKKVMFGGNTAELKKRLVDWWLNLTEENLTSQYNQTYITNLLKSSIKDENLSLAETIIQKELITQMNTKFDDTKAIQYLLASMLYCYPYQLPLEYNLTNIPNWLLNDYLKFTFEHPCLFKEIGEVNKSAQYLERWVNYLHNNIFNQPHSEFWQTAAMVFTKQISFIPLYLAQVNFKYLCIKRAEIMEFTLKCQGYEIDYDFPQRMPGRNKIRLGILTESFDLRPETFTTLPIYKHLNRDIFEIVIYSFWSNGHRLERYCSGHADAGIQLPADLENQIKTIRDDDLDILYIADNITVKTTQISFMALHRLARVQVADINSLVTTGIRNIDYYISGELSESERSATQHYTEKLITLSGSGICWDFATEAQGMMTTNISRESIGIDENDIVYICGSGADTILPEVEATWAKIIASVPNSKLVLYPFNLKFSSSYPFQAFKQRLAATFEKYNLAEDRVIILEPIQNRAELKACLKLADIYLDAYPCSDKTSLIAALEIGLPTVVMAGDTADSKVSSSLLQEIKVFDLIADTEESYIQLAIILGTKPEFHEDKKNQIYKQMQLLPRFLDSRSHSADIEVLLQKFFLENQDQYLNENLNLRDTNLIIFPDWNQPEDLVCEELAKLIKILAIQPESQKMTLLIYVSNVNTDYVELLLSTATMNLLMEEELDISETIEISLILPLADIQWKVLLSSISGRIILEHEDKEAIAELPLENLQFFKLDNFQAKAIDNYVLR
ncbi:MAG: glycosyltransferase [Nostoc sp. ZfuVER08]|uniref:Glycosyltransferase n=1 Tax=Nostoc punctiforme FACHB-252 TaxID=1357509 RepID=A0ABR8H6Q9_NOSPU|nr:glycosyltransferase [Nostoc punctiforme]MBD2610738.1 glycosyltransferase [Nostoc punctiforme FACHB-252]MDZ8014812.1 glycosyltransferase [Nostoc sp. ZfuVER08]